MPVERWLRIDYVDGTSETYSFPKQATDNYDQTYRLNEALQADRIVLESDGQLHIIPMSAIKRIHFAPAPAKLPDQVIKDASLR